MSIQVVENAIWVQSFEEEKARDVCRNIIKTAERDESEPIILYIDSYGGSVDGMAGIIGAIDSVPNHIITVAVGKAMSAGAILLSHGDTRFVAPHASIMIHEISAASWGHIKDIDADAKYFTDLNDKWMGILANNCKKTPEQLKNILTHPRNLYMNAQQSIRFGIADQIGVPRVEKHTTFQIKVNHRQEKQAQPKKPTKKGKNA